MLCDGNDQRYLSFQGIFDGLCGLVSGDIDGGRIWLRLLFCLEPGKDGFTFLHFESGRTYYSHGWK